MTRSIVFCLCFMLLVACTKPSNLNMFQLIPETHTGIGFENKLVEKYDNNILRSEYFYNGAGVSAGDVNNDRLVDLYFVSNQGDNKLYLNQGDFKFKDITHSAMVKGHSGWAEGSAMVDINNDGYLDIYVSYGRSAKNTLTENQFFINNGNLTFMEMALPLGVQELGQSNQTAFLDYDLDGDLDMYITNHLAYYPQVTDTVAMMSQPSRLAGDRLYRNDNLRFKDVTQEAGIQSHVLGFGLGVGVGDLNQDGWPDLYIGNDFIEKDYLYLNNGNGTFEESSLSALGHMSNFSMGNDIADFNNDGLLDIISLDMAGDTNYDTKVNMAGMNPKGFNDAVKGGFHHQYMYNTLQMNRGNGKFSEIAQLSGVEATDWSWSPLLADFDNDGYKDLFVTNGFRRNFRNKDFQDYQKKKYTSQKWTKETIPYLMKDLLEKLPVDHVPNHMYQNVDGLEFENQTQKWGFDTPSFSNGAAYADLDNDGDLDIVVNNIDEKAFVYKNNASKITGNNFLGIKFEGPDKNKDGIGTKATLYQKADTIQFGEQYMVRGYLSSVPRGLHFGLGNNKLVDSIRVEWPNGKSQLLKDVPANQTITVKYVDASEIAKLLESSDQFFENIPLKEYELNFTHSENSFDDYKKQILLPHKYSQMGPGIGKGDVNADGLDDFYIGGANGQMGELYVQNAFGQFQLQKGPWDDHAEREDMAATFFDANGDGFQDLYVVSGGNEWPNGEETYQDRLYLNKGDGTFKDGYKNLPKLPVSGSKVRPYDFDDDGDMDLFVGGRLVAQKYPMPASGYLLKNEGGKFVNATQNIAPELNGLGLITDALWEDVDGDTDKDLVVVGEWMPVTIFLNKEGRLIKSGTVLNGLENTNGWWYSVASADFDNDGDMDLVAGNLGKNYKYKASIDEPFEVYASDFDENNALDIVLGFHEEGQLYPLRGRQCSSDQMPYIKKKYSNYKEFASATILDMVGKEKMDKALNLKAKTFATTYFQNDGKGTFKVIELPPLAQISSTNDILVDDYDSDGHLDILLVGNLYQSEVETPRNDASYGLVLLGDGKGNFEALHPRQSGLYVEGDSKEAVKITINHQDYILVAKNNQAPQLIKIKR